MRIRVLEKVKLEKVKAFPFDGYRFVARYPNVDFITAVHRSGIKYFCLHLRNGSTATYNTVDYIMEFQ